MSLGGSIRRHFYFPSENKQELHSASSQLLIRETSKINLLAQVTDSIHFCRALQIRPALGRGHAAAVLSAAASARRGRRRLEGQRAAAAGPVSALIVPTAGGAEAVRRSRPEATGGVPSVLLLHPSAAVRTGLLTLSPPRAHTTERCRAAVAPALRPGEVQLEPARWRLTRCIRGRCCEGHRIVVIW